VEDAIAGISPGGSTDLSGGCSPASYWYAEQDDQMAQIFGVEIKGLVAGRTGES
jgi:hypothetical protein